jgi:hypothetical protein
VVASDDFDVRDAVKKYMIVLHCSTS